MIQHLSFTVKRKGRQGECDDEAVDTLKRFFEGDFPEDLTPYSVHYRYELYEGFSADYEYQWREEA